MTIKRSDSFSKALLAGIYPPARGRRPSSGGVRNRQLLFVFSTCLAISSFFNIVRHPWHADHDSIYAFNNNTADPQFEHPKRTVFPRVFLFAGESTAAQRIIKYEEEGNFSLLSHLRKPQQESREQCIFRPWQTASHPNCNEIHTFSADALISFLKRRKRKKERSHKFFTGGNRIAFLWPKHREIFVYKTTLFEKEFDFMTFEFSKREAEAMEMLNTSVGIYGFCGMTSLTEYGDGYSLTDIIRKRDIAPLEKLEYAVNLTRAVANVHSIDAEDGYASLIHGDLDGGNVFFVRGQLKLIDFHDSIFVPWNENTRRPCFPTLLPKLGVSFDTIPPERLREATLDEKIDIYKLGALLFYILAGALPYHCDRPPGICNQGVGYNNTLTELEIKMLKNDGTPPVLPEEIEKSSHLAIIVIRDAMKRMLQQDAKRRPSAQEVASELDSALKYLTVTERLAKQV